MQPQKVQTSFRVRYAETDQMGVVYYSNYLVWMEVARVAYCRAVGFEYREMEHQDGAFLAVTEASCKYRVPARFDDEVCITCWVSESRSRSVCFSYEMHRNEELLATGNTKHAVTNAEGKMIRMPEKYRVFFPLPSRV